MASKPIAARSRTSARSHKEKLLEVIGPGFEVSRGRALPLGATVERGGVNFAVFSEHATHVTLVLFRPGEMGPIAEFPFDPRVNRTGNIWHAFVGAIDPGLEYGYRVDRRGLPANPIHRFDPAVVLLDPYAHGCSRTMIAANNGNFAGEVRRSVIVEHDFDWEHDQPLDLPLADSVIYELHVRAFTRDDTSLCANPGTFSALAEKIPYLHELGITAVELMPVVEFDEADNPRTNPVTGRKLANFWGYHPLSFFAPHLPYGSTPSASATARELKQMVKKFHAAGIEVILDVVFNHSGEGERSHPSSSFRGLDNSVYYLLDPATGDDRNYSGCGNTLNCNHPVFRDLVLDCLRYWVTEFHVDGFRFDLASILGRGRDGAVLSNPPLVERIASDPVLARTKLIAEAWDASGLYQVGTFPAQQRWAEWNGRYRDDIRRFVRGDHGMASAMATRLAGSSDLYQADGRAPSHSINFVTCHDGFTLADLVSYEQKHNEANGEENRDGCSHNVSWNCGTEGPTHDSQIVNLRRRQIRNFAALLLLSHGVPLLLFGDEFGRTQQGNNNLYCHDNELSWVDWTLVSRHRAQIQFFRKLIAFRRAHRVLRRSTFLPAAGGPLVHMEWHGKQLHHPDWSHDSTSLAVHIFESAPQPDHIYLIANTHHEAARFELPSLAGWRWTRFADTADDTQAGIAEPEHEIPLAEQTHYVAQARSVVVLVGKPEARSRA
ncbi:MAG TPA: glycogen debranching protein GlgX [Candidatus Angelobacter sp.]|nr:glycogen debranching protein GlgX [Candidatus Angelobacter sp.]